MSTFQAKRYRQLVNELGEAMGYRYGWKSKVARQLGVHPSYVSKVLAEEINDVGGDVLKRALDALDLDSSFFFAVDENALSRPHAWYRREEMERRSSARQASGVSAFGGPTFPVVRGKLTQEQIGDADAWHALALALDNVFASLGTTRVEDSEYYSLRVDREAARALAKLVMKLPIVAHSMTMLEEGDTLPDGQHASLALTLGRFVMVDSAAVLVHYYGAPPEWNEADEQKL